jgi:hypothetical protein
VNTEDRLTAFAREVATVRPQKKKVISWHKSADAAERAAENYGREHGVTTWVERHERPRNRGQFGAFRPNREGEV